MRHETAVDVIAGMGVVAATRILFRSRVLYDVDSVNFALGLRRFDPTTHQPHPPGYFLYVTLGRLLERVVREPNTALVAISIAASCAAAWMIYLLTRDWFGVGAARISLVLFTVSPLCWFHGIVALTYMVEASASAAIGYCCWKAISGREWMIFPASLAFALAAGFRPSSALMLAPMWIYALFKVGPRRRWAILLAAAVAIAWLIPMLVAAGGIRAYFGALGRLWAAVPGRQTTLASPWLAVARMATIVGIFVLCFGSASVFAFRASPPAAKEHFRGTLLRLWLTPGLLFFSLVFLNFVNSGYLLVLCPPIFAILSARAHNFLTYPRLRLARWAAVGVGIAVNCAIFVWAPIYCSYASVRRVERDVAAIAADFRSGADAGKTLIVGFDSHFLGYRHAGYYLPEFVTVQFPEFRYEGGRRVFLMQAQSTTLTSRFSIRQFDRFVLFPLPEGEAYADYFSHVASGLPAGTLKSAVMGHRKVWTGPASAIPLLFSTTASATAGPER